MRHLIAIMTCHARAYRLKANAQRATWVPRVNDGFTEVRFFLGEPDKASAEQSADESWLACPDGYASIPRKVQLICRWAVRQGYDYITKLDDDCYVVSTRWPRLRIAPYDYVGRFRGPCGGFPAYFASGFCYHLSNRAARIIANADLPRDWMDERYVANTLAYHNVGGHSDPANYLVTGPFTAPEDLPRSNTELRNGTVYCQYDHKQMLRMHEQFEHAPVGPVVEPQAMPLPRVSLEQLNAPLIDHIPPEKLNRGN